MYFSIFLSCVLRPVTCEMSRMKSSDSNDTILVSVEKLNVFTISKLAKSSRGTVPRKI